MLNSKQGEAFNLCQDGHNVCITGKGGTGKTFTVKSIVRGLRARGKSVAITCSTGIACTQYSDLGAVTLHSWGGFHDGRYGNAELQRLIESDDKFAKVKSQVLDADVLVIDEISMISKKLFSQLDFICRGIRGRPGHSYGGLQIIVTGDFYQLPPVPNELYGDSGKYAFESPAWSSISHHVMLVEVVRQTEEDLIQAVSELETGQVSETTAALLRSLDRSLPSDSTPVHLFARNFDVDVMNYEQLESMPGDCQFYTSKQSGDSHYLNKMTVQKVLRLKVGCPVILLKNLSSELVNGLQGTVTELHKDHVYVRFGVKQKEVVVSVSPETFSVFDPVMRKVLASRTQLPLKLSFALTIHKSQGMTLPAVVVHCAKGTQPGQIGVAVGRAVSLAGLQVLDFKASQCVEHPLSVHNFYELTTLNPRPDLQCCRFCPILDTFLSDEKLLFDASNCAAGHDEFAIAVSDDEDFSDLDDIEVQALSDLLDSPAVHVGCVLEARDLPADIAVSAALDSVYAEFIDTPQEMNGKLVFDKLSKEIQAITITWFQQHWFQLSSILESCVPADLSVKEQKLAQAKHFTAFTTKAHEYISSYEYTSTCQALITQLGSKTGVEHSFLFSLILWIQKELLTRLADKVVPETEAVRLARKDMSEGGRGKVRYVAGYCVAKAKYRVMTKMKTAINAGRSIAALKTTLSQIEHLEARHANLLQTSVDLGSLLETKRKQNVREGLTNVTDDTFQFFMSLENKCWYHLTDEGLAKSKDRLFAATLIHLLKDDDLVQAWSSLFPGEAPNDLLSTIVTKFANVYFSQFRKDYLSKVRTEKSKALRKKVMEKKAKKATAAATFILKDIRMDASVNRTRQSHTSD
jgi:hypothetical protein